MVHRVPQSPEPGLRCLLSSVADGDTDTVHHYTHGTVRHQTLCLLFFKHCQRVQVGAVLEQLLFPFMYDIFKKRNCKLRNLSCTTKK
jgi:hypothetical protein